MIWVQFWLLSACIYDVGCKLRMQKPASEFFVPQLICLAVAASLYFF